jgi:hypothetical protein
VNIVFSVILLIGALYFVWWGYKNLLRRESDPEADAEGVACHLCGRVYPREQVVTVEKKAGFENYFCGECIAKLAADYNDLVREGSAPPIFTEHVLNGDDGVVARYN